MTYSVKDTRPNFNVCPGCFAPKHACTCVQDGLKFGVKKINNCDVVIHGNPDRYYNINVDGEQSEVQPKKDNPIKTHEVVEIPITNTKKSNKYMHEVLPGVWIDIYDVIDAFGLTDGGYQHALKKMLNTGSRGHKDEIEDRDDILASVKRSNERFNLTNREEG